MASVPFGGAREITFSRSDDPFSRPGIVIVAIIIIVVVVVVAFSRCPCSFAFKLSSRYSRSAARKVGDHEERRKGRRGARGGRRRKTERVAPLSLSTISRRDDILRPIRATLNDRWKLPALDVARATRALLAAISWRLHRHPRADPLSLYLSLSLSTPLPPRVRPPSHDRRRAHRRRSAAVATSYSFCLSRSTTSLVCLRRLCRWHMCARARASW